MKKNQFFLALGLVVIAATAFVADKSIVGSWNVHYGDGASGTVVFRKDGTDEATWDGTNWKLHGTYKVEGSKVSIADSSCGLGYWGTYKANWYSDDSVQVSFIADTCGGRRHSVEGSVLVRAK